MRLLLDANALIWAVDNPAKLGTKALSLLTDPTHERWISAGTVWEIAIKMGLDKLKLSQPLRVWMNQALVDLAASLLPISVEHAHIQASLTNIHRDPFDRLLAAQAIVEQMEIVSTDEVFDHYGVTRHW